MAPDRYSDRAPRKRSPVHYIKRDFCDPFPLSRTHSPSLALSVSRARDLSSSVYTRRMYRRPPPKRFSTSPAVYVLYTTPQPPPPSPDARETIILCPTRNIVCRRGLPESRAAHKYTRRTSAAEIDKNGKSPLPLRHPGREKTLLVTRDPPFGSLTTLVLRWCLIFSRDVTFDDGRIVSDGFHGYTINTALSGTLGTVQISAKTVESIGSKRNIYLWLG